MPGIQALSYYVPRFSIKSEEYVNAWGYFTGRGIREKTVAGYDEDEITMGLEAASGLPLLDGVGYLAAATFPGPRMSTTLVTALGLDSAQKADFSGSTNASGEALLSCLDFVEAQGRPALVVAANLPRGRPEDPLEHPMGAAAVASIVTPDGGLQVERRAVRTREEMGELFLDNERRRRSLGVTDLGPQVIQEAASQLASRGQSVWGVCPEPDGRFARRSLEGLVEPSMVGGGVVELTGDTGCCSPLLSLAQLMSGRKRGDRILLVTYGGGSSVALSLRVEAMPSTPPPPREALQTGRTYLDYLQYARFQGFLSAEDASEASMGAYLSIPSYLESIQERYRLLGSRCSECGELLFPPKPSCIRCGSRSFTREPLSGKGEVYARTVISRGSAPTEFRRQQDLVGEYSVCIIQLEEGPRIIAQLTDCDPNEVELGVQVECVLRRIYRQEGVVRYGYKFRPRTR